MKRSNRDRKHDEMPPVENDGILTAEDGHLLFNASFSYWNSGPNILLFFANLIKLECAVDIGNPRRNSPVFSL
jgi:hypothetical protein